MLFPFQVSAVENVNNSTELENLGFNYPTEIFIADKLELNVGDFKNDLNLLYPNDTFSFEWDIRWASTQKGEKISLKFEEVWEKIINLNVFRNSWELLINKEFSVLSYDKSAPILIQKSFLNKQIEIFETTAGVWWVFFYKQEIDKQKIEETNILWVIENYRRGTGSKADYITVWWDREFIASIISKLGKEISTKNSNITFQILAISPYNLWLLESYLKNFIVEKPWLKKIILVNESAKFQTHKAPESINLLQENLASNEYEYIDVNIGKWGIHKALFISKFINNLSNSWYSSNWIYLIILIPFLFTLLVIIKHLIGLSPIWIMVPIGLTLMIFKFGLFLSVIFFLFFIVLNVVLARAMNTQTLLYTPKISAIIIINIICMMLLINILTAYQLIDLSLSNGLFIIIYIIILEKLINVILSKEFNEYRPALMNSIFIGLIWYIVFSSETITTIILSYPEIILVLIPLNFVIWKFSWLRVTEYFRFREVIKTVEEE